MTARRLLPLLLGMAAASAAFGQLQVTITSPQSLPQGFSKILYTYTFTAFSTITNSTVTWSLPPGSATSLPAGFTLNPNGVLSGTTALPGTFTFQVTATVEGVSATETFSLVLLAPSITISSPPNLGNAFVNQPYSLSLLGSSNPAGLTWSQSSGSLPPGLSLSPSGVISGNPTTVGMYSFLLNAQISGTTISTTQGFTMTVYAGQTTIQTTSLPYAVLGKPYSAILSGGPTGVTWVLTGMLPPGITFNQTTGVFGGTTVEPTAFIAIYPIQIQATFPNYLSATRAFTIYVTSGPLGVPQTALPPAVEGSPYTATVVASGGLPPYQWSLGGASTLGLSIGGLTGIITGTPLTSGNLLLPVILSDATGLSIQVNLSLFVANPLSVATTSLPNGTVGSPYLQPLAANGGQLPYTWLVASGSLPPGLALSSSGVINGTPSAAGTFHFTVQATDAGGRTATGALTLSTGVMPLSITTSSLPNGQMTVPYSQTLAASGGVAPYTWTLVAGTLPAGLRLNSNGTITGTPLGPLALSTFTVQATDSSPQPALTAQKAFTINVALTLTITTIGPLPNGNVGVPYSQTLAGSGGTPPYIWSISSGALPPGLQLTAATGVISGTPTATGPNLFTVTLTDSAGLAAGPQQLDITITTLSITSSNALSATYNTALSQTLTATGGAPPYTWSISSGALPAGLQLSGGGVISGTPTAPGTASVTLKVTDSLQETATQALTITVAPPPTPAVTIGAITSTAATQQPVSLALASSFPAAVTGTLSVSFQSAAGGSPTEVQFTTASGGSSTASFSIPANALNAVFSGAPVLVTGTVAGTITLTATLSAGGVDITPTPAPTETITIAPSAPVIQSVNFSNTGGSLTVTVTGYSTTRQMVSGQFTFAPTSGNTLSQSAITVQLGSAFSTWYQSSASNQYGGQFMLTEPFTVSATAAGVASVSVTLTNTQGVSAAAAPQ
jgi:large repetitive protein